MNCTLTRKTKQVKVGKVVGGKKVKGDFVMQSSVKCLKYSHSK